MTNIAIKKVNLLKKLNQDLTSNVPLVEPDLHLFSHPKGVNIWNGNINGRSCKRMIIYLRSDVGCEHGTKTGGCSGCKHWRLGTAGKKLDIPNMYITQYLSAVKSHGLQEIVSLYNEGNLLNNDEIPTEQLVYIISHMANNNVKKLIIESRPEFINQDKLNRIKDIAGNMIIEVGIGLESISNFVRNELFLKDMTLEDYESAIRILNSNGINTLTYVLLKPAFLNELQAIEEAISTIKYAFKVGSKAVSLEPIGVEPYTLTQILYETNRYIPPKLWSILEVVKQTYMKGEIRIGSCQIEPRPTDLPMNCKLCTNKFLEQFEVWNQTYDISVLDELYCTNCSEAYFSQIKNLERFFCEKTINSQISSFINSYYSKVEKNIV